MAEDSGMYLFPSAAPVMRRGALPYGPVERSVSGERKGRLGSVGGLRVCRTRLKGMASSSRSQKMRWDWEFWFVRLAEVRLGEG